MQKVHFLTLAAALLASGACAQNRPAGHSPVKRLATKTPPKHPAVPVHKAIAKPAPPAPKPQVAVPLAPAAKPVATSVPAPARPAGAKLGTFCKGSSVVNLGVGFGLGEALVASNVSSMPALSASYMFGLAQAGPGTISVGGLVGYKSYRWDYGSDKATWRHLFVGARGAYHYGFGQPNLDTYAGVGLGVRTTSYADGQGTTSSSMGSQLELSSFVGARYFFTPAIGGFAELGYDMSLLKVGISARF